MGRAGRQILRIHLHSAAQVTAGAPGPSCEGPFLPGDEITFELDAKYGWDRIHEAVSLGYGHFFENGIHQVNAAAYSNWYYNKRLYYCFSPTVSFLYASNGNTEGDAWGINAVANNSITYEFSNHFYLRPQVGLNVVGLVNEFFIFNYGIAGGVAF